MLGMKKFVSGVLLSSTLLNGGAMPALAAAPSSQTVSVQQTKNASAVLIRNYVQYLAGNAQMNQNADVKSKLDAINKNAEKALALSGNSESVIRCLQTNSSICAMKNCRQRLLHQMRL